MTTHKEVQRYLSSVVLVLVEPKPGFCELLVALRETAGKRIRSYYEEENAAYLLPSDGRLGPERFTALIEELKPTFLDSELTRFNLSSNDFSDAVDASTFDEHFELKLRDQLVDAQSLNPEILQRLHIPLLEED